MTGYTYSQRDTKVKKKPYSLIIINKVGSVQYMSR